ncbi:PAS domain S-box protein, partial [Aquisalimonas sp.]
MSTENNNAWLNSMTEERDTKLLRALLDEPHLLVIVVSEDGLMEVFNRGCERLTGFSTDDMIGQPLEAVLRMTSDEEQSAPILCHAGRTQLVNWRHRWLGPDTDGRRRRLIVGRFPEGVGQSTPVDWLFGDGHIARVTIENAIDGIIAIDSNGTICSVNPAAERLFGYRAEEMQGRNIGMLMPEPHRSQHDHYIRRYLETGVRRIIGMRR